MPSEDAEFYRWSDLPRVPVIPGLERRIVFGDEATLAMVDLVKGTVLDWHSHPNEQFTFIVSGALKYTLVDEDGPVIVVNAGEQIRIPGGIPHLTEALEDTVDYDVFVPPREDWRADVEPAG